MEKYLKSVFDSIGCQKLFATCFDEEIYHQANIFYEKNNFFPMRYCYSIIAVTKVIEYLKNHITARIDFKLYGAESPDFEVIFISDSRASVTKPKWFQKEGIGYVVESYAGHLDISFRSAAGGSLKIWERGRSVCEGQIIELPIGLSTIMWNIMVILYQRHKAWHGMINRFVSIIR